MTMLLPLVHLVLVLSLGTSLTAQSSGLQGDNVCLEWVDPFWDVLTLGEERPATEEDFNRLFNLVDQSGNGEVPKEDFTAMWRGATYMSHDDSELVFRDWAALGGGPEAMTRDDFHAVTPFYDIDLDGAVEKQEFSDKWKEVLPGYPHHGCPQSLGSDVTPFKIGKEYLHRKTKR